MRQDPGRRRSYRSEIRRVTACAECHRRKQKVLELDSHQKHFGLTGPSAIDRLRAMSAQSEAFHQDVLIKQSQGHPLHLEIGPPARVLPPDN
jgi:hypothetical protein